MSDGGEIAVTGPLWRWTAKPPAKGSWFFITITGEAADHARMRNFEHRKAFGSVKVAARVGSTRFSTSLFPNKGDENYWLPVKAAVRKAENLSEDDEVTVWLVV